MTLNAELYAANMTFRKPLNLVKGEDRPFDRGFSGRCLKAEFQRFLQDTSKFADFKLNPADSASARLAGVTLGQINYANCNGHLMHNRIPN